MSNPTRECSIWQTWSSWKAEIQADSPLLSDVLIRSNPPLAVNDIIYSICIAPQLDMVTIVISTTAEHKMGKAWKEYSYEGLTFGMDSCWGDIVCADPFLIKDIMAKLPLKYKNVSFVGVGGGAALATLCGLCAPQHTSASISVYSFGAPRLGGGKMVQLYRRLENEGRLRILSFVNVCDTVTQHPNGWWNLRSGFHVVGRAVYFSSKVKGMRGYWQHLQNWDALVPFEEWLKLEEARHRWSKKWIFVLFILSIYTPIILLTLVSPGLQNFKVIVTRESLSVVSSAPTTGSKESCIDVPKVSESAWEVAARNVSHQPFAKAQAASRENVEKDSEQTQEAEKEDAAVAKTGVNLGFLHLKLGQTVNFDIVVRHDSVDRGLRSPLLSPNSTDKTDLSDGPDVRDRTSARIGVVEHSSGKDSTGSNELFIVDEAAQRDANKDDAAVLGSIESPHGSTLPMVGKPEPNVMMGEVVKVDENVPRIWHDTIRHQSNEVEDIIDAGGQDGFHGCPSQDNFLHAPQVAVFDDDLTTDANYGVNLGEKLHGVAIDQGVGDDVDSTFVVSVEKLEPGQINEVNPAISTFSDETSVESTVSTILPPDFDLDVVIDEKASPTASLASYEDRSIPRAIALDANQSSPGKSLQGELEIVVEEIEVSELTGTESPAYVAGTSNRTEPDGTHLREASEESIAPKDEVLKLHPRRDDLETLRDEELSVPVARSAVETGEEHPGSIVDSIHLGYAIVERGTVATPGCDIYFFGVSDQHCPPMRDSTCHPEEESVIVLATALEALAETNTAVDEGSSGEHRDAIDQDVELDALANPNTPVDEGSSRQHRDAVEHASFQAEIMEQQSCHDAHGFQNEKTTTMDAEEVDDTEGAKSALRADGVQTNGIANMGVDDSAEDACLIGADPYCDPSGHDPKQGQSEPESDTAVVIASNLDAVGPSHLFGKECCMEGDASTASHERFESHVSNMDAHTQELSIGPHVTDRPWGSSLDLSFLARSIRKKSPLMELDTSVIESRSQRQVVNHVFDRWETMNWWKSQAVHRLDTESAATAIVREAFLRSGVKLDDSENP
jgi:hypothetical protein